ISSKSITYGYLFIEKLNNSPKIPSSINNKTFFIRHILYPISLWFNREQTIFETEIHHQDKFVWDLIKGNQKSFNELNTRAKSIGYNLDLPYICIVGKISNLELCYRKKRHNYSSYEAWKFNCI